MQSIDLQLSSKDVVIQRSGDICILDINPTANEKVSFLNNVFQLCEDCIKNLPTHEKLGKILSNADIELIEMILKRNEVFKNSRMDETPGNRYCFNIIALQDLSSSLEKNEKIISDLSNELLKESMPIIFAIEQALAILDGGDIFGTMGLKIYKNIQSVSITIEKEHQGTGQDNLTKIKMYLAFFTAYLVESKRLNINDQSRLKLLIDGLELNSQLDISLFPEDIKVFYDFIPKVLSEDFSDICKHGELIGNFSLKEGERLSDKIALCAKILLFRPIIDRLNKFVESNF